MLADKIESSDEYLAYSKKILTESGVLKEFPKISDYYYDLCAKFKCTFNDMELTPLKKNEGSLGPGCSDSDFIGIDVSFVDESG